VRPRVLQSATCPVRELTSARVDQSASWQSASCPVTLWGWLELQDLVNHQHAMAGVAPPFQALEVETVISSVLGQFSVSNKLSCYR